MARSSSPASSVRMGSASSRSRSSARISSARGGTPQCAAMPAAASSRSGSRAAEGGTSRTLTPLRPARPGAAAAMLQHLRVARQVRVDDEAEVRQVEAARGDVGGDAHLGAPVAQRLQRVVALVLAEFARQQHGGEAALAEQGVQVAHALARVAEDDGARRIDLAQDVDDRVDALVAPARARRGTRCRRGPSRRQPSRCAARRPGSGGRARRWPWAGWRRTAACAARPASPPG